VFHAAEQLLSHMRRSLLPFSCLDLASQIGNQMKIIMKVTVIAVGVVGVTLGLELPGHADPIPVGDNGYKVGVCLPAQPTPGC
jgi:hypothetical protein